MFLNGTKPNEKFKALERTGVLIRRFYQQARKFPKRSNLIAKVASHLSIKKEDFAELLLTEYPIESVINWHRDAPPFDLIAGISLLSNCTLLAALR